MFHLYFSKHFLNHYRAAILKSIIKTRTPLFSFSQFKTGEHGFSPFPQQPHHPPFLLLSSTLLSKAITSFCGREAKLLHSWPKCYGADRLAIGAPIIPPDFTKCGPPDLPAGAKPVNCCPPTDFKIFDFKPPSHSAPLRIRQAAHLVDNEYIAKYTEAYELMRALPEDDPRSFKQQANIHCAYCDGAYDQIGFPDLQIQVHNSWLFFPFHRYYLYFHEKILGSLIGDPTFALPFWNWDSPAGMRMPKYYTNSKSALYNKLRDAKHQPPL
ncbi:hypothetical protein GIB67_024984 [Kingdonia uniflora]|uniref:Tyrosinase copper-binding domain-containing protein n=1 Tax=Kingdonia uniflora TaxID=39325 RepID=A0A7J7N7W7_9MAGN|nr:hypothetical protein GIB67_024984 [Kingdonia uniflora]